MSDLFVVGKKYVRDGNTYTCVFAGKTHVVLDDGENEVSAYHSWKHAYAEEKRSVTVDIYLIENVKTKNLSTMVRRWYDSTLSLDPNIDRVIGFTSVKVSEGDGI